MLRGVDLIDMTSLVLAGNFFMFHIFMLGKSLRDGSANLFGIRRHSDLSLCSVKALELYIAISSALSPDLLSGYLFRPLSSSGKI